MGLHHFFKSAYEGQAVRAYGPGTNFLPTVHVDDLASYCIEVIQSKPPDQYLLVADDGQITLGQFVQVRGGLSLQWRQGEETQRRGSDEEGRGKRKKRWEIEKELSRSSKFTCIGRYMRQRDGNLCGCFMGC